MTRAVMTAFHNYTYMQDRRYYKPIFDYFMKNFKEVWYDEVDKLYLVDSTWGIEYKDPKVEILKMDASTRYYNAYKMLLSRVKEDLILFMDNDMVVYRKWIVDNTFRKLEGNCDVVSIYDTLGDYHFDELGGQSKFCPYWFATKVELLKKYRYVEWGPNMPVHETLGELTKEMLVNGVKPEEMEEDKTDEGKDLGYYHIRAGSTPAYLLTTKFYGNSDEYWSYLKNQPESEILRHCNWYDRMGGDSSEIRKDLSEKNRRTL